jgi:hypothetical protein
MALERAAIMRSLYIVYCTNLSMTDSDVNLKSLLERNNELLENNIAALKEQTRVVKEINDKVRKVVVNTST